MSCSVMVPPAVWTLEAIKLGAVDDVLPLQSIAGRVLELVHGKPGGGKGTGSPLEKSSDKKVSGQKNKGQKDSSRKSPTTGKNKDKGKGK